MEKADGTFLADEAYEEATGSCPHRDVCAAGLSPMNWIRRLRLFKVRGQSWLLNLLNQGYYHRLSESELRATRKSTTMFIFGSGYSINAISPAEWEHFEQHDTVSFNLFVHQDRVRIDYHLIREIGNISGDPRVFMPEVNEYVNLIHHNPRYADAILVVQEGWHAIGGNHVVGMKLLPQQARLFRFRNRSRGIYGPPSPSFSKGLVHGPAALVDCVNFAYILGWKRIVLVGVDLYDRRYFWLDSDETRNIDQRRRASHQDRHNTANAIIPFMAQWRELFSNEGVELYVYNPRSLLAQELPIYYQRSVVDICKG